MKSKLSRLFIGLAAVAFCCSLNTTLWAQSATPPTPPPPPASASSLLTQAYVALAQADHDYQGHRVHAMKQIEMAAKVLGFSLNGNGHGHEKQVASDQQLRTAQSLLQQAVAGLPPAAQKHVQNAIDQISAALSIK